MEIKYIEDYYDKVKEKYPELTEKQISKILTFGFRSFYLHTLYGGDILSKSPYLTVYCGRCFVDTNKFMEYRNIKLRTKLRVKYKKAKTQWDGYYYFGMSDNEFEYYQSQMKSHGRRRQKFHFKNIYLFKVKNEVLLNKKNKHVFRIAYPLDCGFSIYKEDVVTRNFEYILRLNKDKQWEPVSYE